MKLESIQLENIRSHIKTVVEFSDGFNCLVGGLGQGKSTVLYAFDFVLFGDPLGRSYDYLLREDAEQGKVTAVFIQNGRTYKLKRALQRHGKGISQDIDHLKFYRDGKLVAENAPMGATGMGQKHRHDKRVTGAIHRVGCRKSDGNRRKDLFPAACPTFYSFGDLGRCLFLELWKTARACLAASCSANFLLFPRPSVFTSNTSN